MLKYFTFILLLISTSISAKDKCLGICAIFQNEAPYLSEWIEFHSKQGFKKFYLYNNLSTDNYKNILDKYIQSGIVELTEWPYAYENHSSWTTIQCDAYNHALSKMKGKVEWCAFIDTDEFIFSPRHETVKNALKEFKSYPGVCVNLVCYGMSNVSTRNLLKNLVYRSHFSHPLNKFCKSIVHVNSASHCVDPHFFFYHTGFGVTENMVEQKGSISEKHSVEKLRINHYWSRDLDFFWNNKIPRHLLWGTSIEDMIQIEKDFNSVYDLILSH